MMHEFKRELDAFLETLTEFERKIANAILDEKPDKVAMEELNIEKQSSYSYHKVKMRKTMQDMFRTYYEK